VRRLPYRLGAENKQPRALQLLTAAGGDSAMMAVLDHGTPAWPHRDGVALRSSGYAMRWPKARMADAALPPAPRLVEASCR